MKSILIESGEEPSLVFLKKKSDKALLEFH